MEYVFKRKKSGWSIEFKPLRDFSQSVERDLYEREENGSSLSGQVVLFDKSSNLRPLKAWALPHFGYEECFRLEQLYDLTCVLWKTLCCTKTFL